MSFMLDEHIDTSSDLTLLSVLSFLEKFISAFSTFMVTLIEKFSLNYLFDFSEDTSITLDLVEFFLVAGNEEFG